MIQIEDLRKEYPAPLGTLAVLAGVRLAVRAGESVAIMGPSGSGKSTLLHIIGTLDTPTAGRVTIDGRDPFTLREPELAAFRNTTMGFVFQDHALLPQCTALENVIVPTLALRRAGGAAAAQRARQLLEEVQLTDRADYRPMALSGGECQRVAIARALINAPRVLLCDEPTGNLDAETAQRIAELFVSLQRAERLALIVVTHNEAFARRFDRVLRLKDGGLQEN